MAFVRRLILGSLALAASVMAYSQTPTMWVIGDSTVHNTTSSAPDAQWGWGDPLRDLVPTTQFRVVNRAIGGRSSRTFITEGRWEAILAEAKAGDVVIMQFGHNDSGALNDDSRARGTIRGIGDESQEIDNLLTKKHETVHSYGWYLTKIVKEAKEHGLRPLIVSPVPRCPRPGTKLVADEKPASYRLWASQIAEREGALYIDLYAAIWADYLKLTPEEIKSKFFGEKDFTHTNHVGAEMNAKKVLDGLVKLGIVKN